MPDGKKPWEKYSNQSSSSQAKPWEKYSGEVKKKESSQPTSQEDVWGSKSQPQDVYTSLVTDQPKPQQVLDTSDGEQPKMRTLGVDITTEEALTPSKVKEEEKFKGAKPFIKKIALQKELASTKVTSKNQDQVNKKIEEVSALNKQIKQEQADRLKSIEQDFYNSQDHASAEVEADSRLENLLTNTGVWNNIKSTAKDVYNYAIGGISKLTDETGIQELKVSTDPLADEKAQVKKQAAKDRIKLSDQEINEKAKDLFKSKEIENIETDRINSFLDDLPDADRVLLKQDRAEKAVHLQESNIKEQKVIDAFEVVGNQKIDEYKKLEDQLKKIQGSGQQVPQDLYNQYIGLGTEIKNIASNIKKRQDVILKNKQDLGTVKDEFDFFKRTYGDVGNFLSNAGITTRELGVNIVSGLDFLASQMNPLSQISSIQLQSKLSDINQGLSSERDNLRKSVQSIESPEGFVNYASDIMANQLPNLALTSTGAGGLALIGVASSGQKYTEMNNEVLSGKATYTPFQMAAAPLLYGSAEVISEIPTLEILKNGGRLLDSVIKNESGLITKTAIEKGKEFAKEWVKDTGSELAGEEFTNFAQNFNDKFVLGKKDVGLLDNTGTVFKDTLTLTSMLKATPHIAGAVLKPFQSKNDLGVLDENARKIIQFSKSLNTLNLSEEERSVITDQINKATAENSLIMANTIDNVANMPNDVYLKVTELNKKAAKIKNDARIINDGVLPNKAELLKGLEDEYRSVQSERSGLINTKYEPGQKTEETVRYKPTEVTNTPSSNLTQEYINSIEKAKSESPETFWSVDRPFQKEDGTIDEIALKKAEDEGRLIKTEAGFGVVSEDGDIKGVFKSDLDSSEKTGDKVIQEAVKAGGIKLDNFALPNLMKIYERNGFREVSRIPFNEEYAPEGWDKELHGTPDVVAMVYDPNNELDIEKKNFDDYDQAMEYRDQYANQVGSDKNFVNLLNELDSAKGISKKKSISKNIVDNHLDLIIKNLEKNNELKKIPCR
jgi:hypothetical protein